VVTALATPDDVDPEAVRADDELVEDLIAGKTPNGKVGRRLRRIIDAANRPVGLTNQDVLAAYDRQRGGR
jgi:hypothetical protein